MEALSFVVSFTIRFTGGPGVSERQNAFFIYFQNISCTYTVNVFKKINF